MRGAMIGSRKPSGYGIRSLTHSPVAGRSASIESEFIRVGDRRVRTKAKHVLPVLKRSFYLTTPPNVRSRSTVLWLIAAVITRVVSNNATAKGVSPF